MTLNHRNHQSMRLQFAPSSADDTLAMLFSVTVRHNFYSLSQGFCPDLQIAPTPASAGLMSNLGMAFRADRYGFSIFIQKNRWQDLQAYLIANAIPGAGGALEFWERLTFSMRLLNPTFINVTELPLATKINQRNLYASNCQAHLEDGIALLAPGRYLNGAALFEVIGADVTMRLPAAAKRVVVTDISGSVVLPAPGTDDILIFPASSDGDGAQRAQLDFSDLPYGQYTICLLDAAGQPVVDGKYPWTVLYADPHPDTALMLDMLFTQPTLASAGLYPVPPLFDAQPADAADTVAAQYALPFDARHTYWQYFIVSQGPRGHLRDLQISGPGTRFVREPKPVILPNGASAIVFTAEQPLPLNQHSTQVFQLTGQRSDAQGHENAIRITRLPVAASTPVWPSPSQRLPSGISEIYVYV
jgi:hypothetical protein